MCAETIVWTADGSPATGLDYGTRLVEGLRRLGFTVRQMDLTQRVRSHQEMGLAVMHPAKHL